MIYERQWLNPRNAAGFCAACARLALQFYDGARRSPIENAIKAAEEYAEGAEINRGDVESIADGAFWVSKSQSAAAGLYASLAAASAARTASRGPHNARAVESCIRHTISSSVDAHDMDVAFARWVVRDLSPFWPIDEEIRLAAGAAIVAGDELLAKEILR